MNPARLSDIWVYLAASPLLHLTMTIAAYVLGDWLYRKSGNNALFNPVLIAIIVLVGVLVTTGTKYESYFEGAQFVHFF
ncbi:MAG: LrgB family protein, partial [Burkholderiales bacterium]